MSEIPADDFDDTDLTEADLDALFANGEPVTFTGSKTVTRTLHFPPTDEARLRWLLRFWQEAYIGAEGDAEVYEAQRDAALAREVALSPQERDRIGAEYVTRAAFHFPDFLGNWDQRDVRATLLSFARSLAPQAPDTTEEKA